MKVQTWLDQNYPEGECINPYKPYGKKIKRSEVEEIYINQQLEGELDLKDFTYKHGIKILISHHVDETKFEIKNQSKDAKITKLIKAQEWLDENYPQNDVCKIEKNRWGKPYDNKGKTRDQITWLDISRQNLEGDLDLSDFINLKWLICDYNKLISLNVSNFHQLRAIGCSHNRLTEYWQDIYTSFDYSHWKGWVEQGFNKEQTKQWIGLGFEPRDYLFIGGLEKNNKDIEWTLNNKEEFKNLQKRYRDYDLCKKCQQPNTEYNWCPPCNQQDFTQITSGNKEIDVFIKQQQSVATKWKKTLVWIPYKQFTNIEHLADGGFGKVYKAEWGKYKSGNDRIIALKSLNNSQNMTTEFCQEIANHKLFSGERSNSNIVNCYGISQDPTTKNYLMVMEYIESGNLREYLQNNFSKLSFEQKQLYKLYNITRGLRDIHSKDLVHRDFHSGNILNDDWISSYITDLGLAKPASETDDGKIFGVMPYMAPEVLLEKGYTQASDVYSFGIVAYEMFSMSYPYFDREHNTSLALDICQGLRPQFPDKPKIPQLLEDLINRCWNVDPLQRPTAEELEEILGDWYYEIKYKNNTKFTQQHQETEEFNQALPIEIRFPKYKSHPRVVYTSRLIDTKTIKLQIEQWGSAGMKLDINNFNIPKDPQEGSSTGLTRQFKRQLSLSAEDKPNTKEVKSEPTELMEIIPSNSAEQIDNLEQQAQIEILPKQNQF